MGVNFPSTESFHYPKRQRFRYSAIIEARDQKQRPLSAIKPQAQNIGSKAIVSGV